MLALAIACALVTALPATGFATPTANIELSASHPQANKAFDVSGMLPGDAESMDAVIDVSHTDDANVIFTAVLDEETQRLSEALQARITIASPAPSCMKGPLPSSPTAPSSLSRSCARRKGARRSHGPSR